MKKYLFLALCMLCACLQLHAGVEYILPADATPSEQTALEELQNYLGKCIDRHIRVGGVEIKTIELKRRPDYAPEQWSVTAEGARIILEGNGPRGILYAAYHFLEDALGVRWWAPGEEYVPAPANPEWDSLKLSGQPFFKTREVWTTCNRVSDPAFAPRNRINRRLWNSLPARYGGSALAYPPGAAFVHTFDYYLPAKTLLATNPDIFSLRGEKRRGGQTIGQLCLTNPQTAKLFSERLRQHIQTSRQEARKKGTPPPEMYEISTNDNKNFCECPPCTDAVKNAGLSGVVLRFVNAVATEVGAQYPELLFSTLAYGPSAEPPLDDTRAADNVQIRFCNGSNKRLYSPDAPENKPFVDQLRRWSQLTKHLAIWDYAIDYTVSGPFPNEVHLPAWQRLYADCGVSGMFWEHEFAYRSDMFELKVWLEAKLMESPYADSEKLTNEFMQGYYGKAAPMVSEYRKILAEAAARNPEIHRGLYPNFDDYKFIGLDDLIRIHKVLNEGETAVADDATILNRVRRARLPMDRFTLVTAPFYQAQWDKKRGDFPVNLELLAANQAISWPLVSSESEEAVTYIRQQLQSMQLMAGAGAYVPPKRFQNRRYYDFTADKLTIVPVPHLKTLEPDPCILVRDPESANGTAMRLRFASRPDYFKLPFTVGYHAYGKKSGQVPLRPSGSTYKWYRAGSLPANHGSYYIFLSNTWELQAKLRNIIPKDNPELEIWVRIKVVGDKYNPGDLAGESYIFVERVVLVEPASS